MTGRVVDASVSTADDYVTMGITHTMISNKIRWFLE